VYFSPKYGFVMILLSGAISISSPVTPMRLQQPSTRPSGRSSGTRCGLVL
jgi:hypothetical protein